MQKIDFHAAQKHRSRLFIFLLIGCLTWGTAIADDQNGNTAYRLDSGDKLRVTVYGEADLSGEFEVDGSGAVSLPLIGEVRASGTSLREFEGVVEAALRDGYLVEPRVSVDVLNYRPFYILGEVRSPGKYPYISGITVLNAVAMAGGYTFRARTDQAEIVRTGETEPIVINTPDVTPVMPGDVIRIPERFF